MPPRDPLALLRRVALDGLEARAPTPLRRPQRSRSSVPEIPVGLSRPAREELTGALCDDAERAWRRGTHAWVPSLASLRAAGILHVDLDELSLSVTTRNAVHRGTGLPPRWIPVILAALTGRELQAVRRAISAGCSRFTEELVCQTP